MRQSLEVSTQQLRIDKTTGEVIIADNLLTLFAKLAHIQPEYSNLNLEQQANLIEFCRNFAIKGIKLVKRSKPDSTIVVTFPSYSGNSQSPTYNLFCKYSLIKYSSWSFEDLKEMDNEDAEDRCNIFLETADDNLFRYYHEDVETGKLLVEARDRGDYELVK